MKISAEYLEQSNAHLIQEGPEWWMPKLERRFGIHQFSPFQGEFAVIVRPLAAR
jgi:hypothetical protein